jgi:hypothetical protein
MLTMVPPPLATIARQRALSGVEDRGEVDVDAGGPILGRDVEDAADGGDDGGVVHQDVEGLVQKCRHRDAVGHVGEVAGGRDVPKLALGGGDVGGAAGGEVDGGPRLGQGADGGEADAAVAAGDEGGLAGKGHGGLLSCVAQPVCGGGAPLSTGDGLTPDGPPGHGRRNKWGDAVAQAVDGSGAGRMRGAG